MSQVYICGTTHSTLHVRSKSSHIERFNNLLRQRVSQFVGEALTFSKNVGNCLRAIYSFICHDNLTRATACLL